MAVDAKPRSLQWYYSQADPMKPDATFNVLSGVSYALYRHFSTLMCAGGVNALFAPGNTRTTHVQKQTS